jgi:FAD synthetase
MYSYSNLSFAPGLERCISESGARAFVLGTREGDPNSKGQEAFAPSSDWMPPFMRVNPVIRWR